MKKIDLKKILTLVVVLLATTMFGQTYNFTGTTVIYTVPVGVNSISIDATGAVGGESTSSPGVNSGIPGKGAQTEGTFAVTPGEQLTILVGEQGQTANFVGGGGGGSFVWRTTTEELLVAAGGGGGAGYTDVTNEYIDGIDATITNFATNGNGMTAGAGTAGNGGITPTIAYYASGGAGWLSNGANGSLHSCTSNSTGGSTPLLGGAGGVYGGSNSTNTGSGGYGGGGGSNGRCGAVGGGGGGGYSGGGAGGEEISDLYGGGGGGGSYNSASVQTSSAGVGTGNGVVVITELCDPLIVSSFSDSICIGSQVTLNASSSNGGTTTWSNSIVNNIPFTPSLGTNTFVVTSDNANDCAFNAVIEVVTLPTVNISADNSEICEGAQVTLTLTGTPSTYSWSESIQSGVAFTPSSTGTQTYTVEATDSVLGCVSNESIDITVYEQISLNATLTNAGSGSEGAIDLSVSGGNSSYTYDWDTDGTGDFDDTEDLSGLSNGNYIVVVNSVNGCSATETYTLNQTTGINDFEATELQIFPNPSSGIVNIKTSENIDYIKVLDYTGKVVEIYEGDKTQIDLSEMNKGIYFVEIANAEKKSVVKLLKK